MEGMIILLVLAFVRVNAYSDVLRDIVSDILSYLSYLATITPNINDVRLLTTSSNSDIYNDNNISDIVNDIINVYVNNKVKINVQPIHIHGDSSSDNAISQLFINAFKPYMRFVLYNLHISALLYGYVSQREARDIKALLERHNSGSNVNPSPFYGYVSRFHPNWERSVNVTMLAEHGFIDEGVARDIVGVRYVGERELVKELMVDVMVEHWNEHSVNKARLEKVVFNKLLFVAGCAPKAKEGGVLRGIVFKVEMGLYVSELSEVKLKELFEVVKQKVAYMYRRKALSLASKAERTWFKLYTGNCYFDELEKRDVSKVIEGIALDEFVEFARGVFA